MSGIAGSTILLFFFALAGVLLREGYTRGGLRVFRLNWRSSIRKHYKCGWVEVFPKPRSLEDTGSARPDRADELPRSRRSAIEEIFASLLWSTILHTAWIALFYRNVVDFEFIAKILFGQGDKISDWSPFSRYWHDIVCYFSTLYISSYLIGRVWLALVRKSHLDWNTVAFRMRDQWFYILNGEVLNFRELRRTRDKGILRPEATIITAIVEHGGLLFSYTGHYADHYYDRQGNLKEILLKHTVVACVSTPSKGGNKIVKFGEVAGDSDFFILDVTKCVAFWVNYSFPPPKQPSISSSNPLPQS